MLRIGLTGGIGSGKSTAADFFAELGIPVIDADTIAHQLTISTHPIFTKIVHHFGNTVLDSNGQLKRAKLRELIFSDTTAREWLENLLHPVILQEMAQRLQTVTTSYCILVIPLLAEKKLAPFVDRVLVIDAPENLQIQRTQQRDKLTLAQINSVLQTQTSRAERLALADDIIYNDGDLAKLKQQVTQLHKRYLSL